MSLIDLVGKDLVIGKSLRDYGSRYARLPDSDGNITPPACYRIVLESELLPREIKAFVKNTENRERLAEAMYKHLSKPLVISIDVPEEEIEAFLESWPEVPGNLMERLSGTEQVADARKELVSLLRRTLLDALVEGGVQKKNMPNDRVFSEMMEYMLDSMPCMSGCVVAKAPAGLTQKLIGAPVPENAFRIDEPNGYEVFVDANGHTVSLGKAWGNIDLEEPDALKSLPLKFDLGEYEEFCREFEKEHGEKPDTLTLQTFSFITADGRENRVDPTDRLAYCVATLKYKAGKKKAKKFAPK